MTEKSYPNPVSFRLDESYSRRLQAEAEGYGMSAGEYARRLVLDALEDTERYQLREGIRTLREESGRSAQEIAQLREQAGRAAQEMAQLRKDLTQLREGMAKGVAALLVTAGGLSTDEAKEWVRTKLLENR